MKVRRNSDERTRLRRQVKTHLTALIDRDNAELTVDYGMIGDEEFRVDTGKQMLLKAYTDEGTDNDWFPVILVTLSKRIWERQEGANVDYINTPDSIAERIYSLDKMEFLK